MSNFDRFIMLVNAFCIQNVSGNWPNFWDAGGAKGILQAAFKIPPEVITERFSDQADEFIRWILHDNPRLWNPENYPRPMWLPEGWSKS